MKRIHLFLASVMLLSSCGYVVEPVGYQDYRDEIVGTYYFDEYSETYRDHFYYDVTITLAYGHHDVLLHNFYGLEQPVRAHLDGHHLTIPYQIVGGYEIEGEGSADHIELRLTYRVIDRYHDSPTDFCDVIATREYH